MSQRTCPLCHGRGGDIIIECQDCYGTGYDTSEWDYKAFAQCHTCYGEGEELVEICPNCSGRGFIEDDENDYSQKLYFPTQQSFQNKYYDFDEDIGLYLPQTQEILINLNETIAQLIIASEKHPEILNKIQPREFEEFIGDLFRRRGFEVKLTQKTKDGGKDIIVLDHESGKKCIIECKKYGRDNKVSVNLVRELYGVHKSEGDIFKSILVTTSTFTKGAIDFAKKDQTKFDMELIDYNRLIKLIKDYYGNNIIIY